MAEYYKHEIAKWNVATDDLTLEQEAAYGRVVSMIRLYERPLRHNLRVLSGMWRCNERKAKRLLAELIDAGKLTIEGGLIIDEKAVNDASILRQSRIDKQLAGHLGGIESGKSRRKPLENNDTGEAPALTREEKAREEKKVEEIGKPISKPFSDFWAVWPNKMAKASAEKAWRKLSQADRETAIANAPGWFVKWRAANPNASPIHPASYLNQARWRDEIEPPLLRTINGGQSPPIPVPRPDLAAILARNPEYNR